MQHKFYPGEFGPESPYIDTANPDMDLYSEVGPEPLNTEKNPSDDDLDDWDRLMTVNEVIDTASVNGKGKGKQIVATFAVLLDGEQDYGFSVNFWKLGEDEPLPNGWGE